MIRLYTALLVLIVALIGCNSYEFECLDICHCNTEEEVVYCHEKHLTSFPSIERIHGRLKGYYMLSLRNNDLTGHQMPSEATLRDKLPDLKAIDMHGNQRISCAAISNIYNEIQILSRCEEDPTEYAPLPTNETPPVGASSESGDCDTLRCHLNAYYDKVSTWSENAWRNVKTKVEWVIEHPMVKPIIAKGKEWYDAIASKLRELR